jgi:hypothetical protein
MPSGPVPRIHLERELVTAASRRVAAAGAASRRVAAAGAAGLLLATMISACGTSSPRRAAIDQPCRQVSAVLSDGPDPGVDPVGYAQAQILPLSELHVSQKTVQEAIDRLASAYRVFAHDHGAGSSAKRTVSAARSRINALCPGAAP